jgi:hypothetical protein
MDQSGLDELRLKELADSAGEPESELDPEAETDEDDATFLEPQSSITKSRTKHNANAARTPRSTATNTSTNTSTNTNTSAAITSTSGEKSSSGRSIRAGKDSLRTEELLAPGVSPRVNPSASSSGTPVSVVESDRVEGECVPVLSTVPAAGGSAEIEVPASSAVPVVEVVSTSPSSMASTEPVVVPVINRSSCDVSESYDLREGTIESSKVEEDVGDGTKFVQLIVKGAFRMEENIRNHVGAPVILPSASGGSIVALPGFTCSGGHIGKLLGPFGKLGKCKVKLTSMDVACEVGQRVGICIMK